MIEVCNTIIEWYQSQGYDLTLRQLYYRLVAEDLIENSDRSYKRIGALVNKARLAGLVDWNAIVDRTRQVRENTHFENPAEAVRAVHAQFQIDKWETQPEQVEVWVEKDALMGVIEPVCRALDVPCFSCRGYTSQSAQWRASIRALQADQGGREFTIIHHDPSGLDMSADLRRRFDMLWAINSHVNRIALTMDQIEEYNPPPNFAKVSDSRSDGYIAKYGNQSWELDALEPQVISDLIKGAVLDRRDDDLWAQATEREAEMKERLLDALAAVET
jgi:hypothetical protein